MTSDHKGIFIQQVFPLGAFGPRQWSLNEMRRLFRWLKELGYNAATFAPWGIFLTECEGRTILEEGALYHSGLSASPAFEPGFAYAPDDRYLGGREGLANAAHFREQLRVARDEGLQPWLAVMMTLGGPAFSEDHPQYAAVNGSELFNEGTGLCPSQPEALEYLLDFHARQIDYFDAAEGYLLWPRDPGGCSCANCTPHARSLVETTLSYYRMIRTKRKRHPVAFMSWHIDAAEVPALSRLLPAEISIFEAPRIHAQDVPLEVFERRVKGWQQFGHQVEGWIEVQENPTTLLPTVYPRRVANAMRTMRSLQLDGLWGTCTQNPYLFPLNLVLMPSLWQNPDAIDEMLGQYLQDCFGRSVVSEALEYVEVMEAAWNSVQSMPVQEAGFLGLFVTTFPARLLPQKLINDGVPAAVIESLDSAVDLSRRALTAAGALADAIRTHHAMEANSIIVSAEVFAHRVQMRAAKIPVLQALHAGDAPAAVAAWVDVERACAAMVSAARDAPNTDHLAQHWRRLALLPPRMKMLARHLPELAHTRSFRSINQQLNINSLYHDRRKTEKA